MLDTLPASTSSVLDFLKSSVLDSPHMDITKRQAKARLDIKTDAELARVFGIGRWAVGQWADDEPIPELRRLQLEKLRPDIFDASPRRPSKREAA